MNHNFLDLFYPKKIKTFEVNNNKKNLRYPIVFIGLKNHC